MRDEDRNTKLSKKPSPILKKIQSEMKPKNVCDLARARANEASGAYGVPVKMAGALKSLLASITDDDIEKVALRWREALDATTMTYDVHARNYIERPDHNTRMKAGQLIAAYREGLPVARQVQLSGKFEDLSELLAKAQSSPETMKMLAKMGVQITGSENVIDVPSESVSENPPSTIGR